MYSEIFLPESMYKIDSNISRQNLLVGDIVTGRVIAIKTFDNLLEIDIGNGLTGMMTLWHSTIYSIYRDDGLLSPNVFKLIGKTIRAKVIASGDDIILSRRYHMLEALNILKEQTEFHYASITAFSKLSAFLDIGAGILGKIYPKEFSNVIFKNIRDIGLNVGDVIPVKNLGLNEDLISFNLSRTQMLPNAKDVLSKGDIVYCKVFGGIGDNIGYHVLINKSISGLLDSKEQKLYYGDKVIAVVKRITPKGPKLRFLTF